MAERKDERAVGLERIPEALSFARERLGSASEALLGDPAVQAMVLARMRHGYDLEDAVLFQVHGAMGSNKELADELIGFFLRDLLRLGQRVKSSALRRFLDTGDLVQSVLGDLWMAIASVRFETRGRYLAYLARKLRWKASGWSRGLEAQKRSEHKRAEVPSDELELQAEADSPLSEVARGEDLDRLALGLMRLSERDRQLLSLYLKGQSPEEIAGSLGLNYDAARMALKRAMRRARKVV